MKSLDTNKIFEIFDKDDREIYEKHEVEEIFKDEVVVFSTVVRSINNFFILESSQKGKFKQHYDTIQHRIQYKFFCKYYYLLDSLPAPSSSFIDPTISDLGTNTVQDLLKVFLEYFISIEHYEKCSKINEFITFIDKTY